MTALLRADFHVLRKNRRSLIMSILLPYLILVSTNSVQSEQSFGGALFEVGLALTYGVASTSIMGYPLALARDRENGVLQRLRVTPATTKEIMGSRLAVQMVANLVIALAVLSLGASIHHLHLSIVQYLLVLLASMVGGAMFLAIGQTLVALIKAADTVNSAARLVYIGLTLLGVFGASGALGHSWQVASSWSPVGTLMTLFASVLHVGAWNTHDSETLLTIVGYIAVFTGIGVTQFKWDAR